MKRNIIRGVLALCLICTLMVPVFAEHYTGQAGWAVTFTQAGKLESNFSANEFNQSVTALQPGDTIDFNVSVVHSNDENAAWYMTNEVVKSLEDGSAASNGAYSYTLSYSGPGGNKTIYDSTTLGGTGGDGLNEANDFMENDIFLDNLTKGQSGMVTLHVELEGESQGNAYENTNAILKLEFAVEPTASTPVTPGVSPSPTPTRTTVVRTGDDTNTVPLLAVMGVSGLLLLALGIYGVKNRKKGKGAA